MDLTTETILGISLGRLLLIGMIIVFTFALNIIIRNMMNRIIKKSQKEEGSRTTSLIMIKYLLSAIIILVGLTTAIMMIPVLEKIAISIFAGAGILAVVLGFASQQAFSNIVSGIFIAIFKPFRMGDTIKFQNYVGVIEDITLRHTVVRNYENKRIIVPNSVISQEVIENYHIGETKICRHVEFGISYDSDINKAIKIMQIEAENHPYFLDNRTEEEKNTNKSPITVRVISLGDFSVNLRAWVWAKTPHEAFKLGTDLNKSIKERFDKEGIEIPFPYRTLVYKKDISKPKKNSKIKRKKR